jgi:hypothetical protein
MICHLFTVSPNVKLSRSRPRREMPLEYRTSYAKQESWRLSAPAICYASFCESPARAGRWLGSVNSTVLIGHFVLLNLQL